MDHVRCADDEALRALEEHGITRALVEAGGDIVVSAGWGKAREEIALSGLTVRPAASHDFAAVAGLLAELGRPTLAPDTVETAREVYERHISRGDTASLVAEVDGEVVGFMSLEFRERLNRTQLQGWIPDLIVTETYRGIGAGKALLRRGFELARERGCWSVTLESGYSRTVAHQLYRDAGMIDEGLYFLLYL